ncbi:flagellar hook-basal body complex protein FliE [Marinobacterium zhoushanense]|uniref:Flagellar hook-basal body complex protein FliE n=1 Tax=Marinobacterium zhoushanense TaxID=1679163 RepID=A0ABQ1KUN3_9GAMM|nr:flagellar hook-basal body complex protein FliE [Marinobacterium zhoushanense]GGC07375.1 flagellar hook-basal body complex protein FliE [Marinobacterium zhoushanense]
MIERADINGVLEQMRALKAQAQQGARQIEMPQVVAGQKAEEVQKGGFGDLLKMAIDEVNSQQAEAKKLATAYELGDPSVDLPQVMIQAQKASVSFQAMTQVRNRLVKAYEDVMSMSI